MRVRTNKEPYSDAHSSDVLDRREKLTPGQLGGLYNAAERPQTGGVTKTG